MYLNDKKRIACLDYLWAYVVTAAQLNLHDKMFKMTFVLCSRIVLLHCLDTVGWAAGQASWHM